MTDIPKRQWAQVFETSGSGNKFTPFQSPILPTYIRCLIFIALHFTQVPVPVPGATEVLVNIKYSGVCHSDLQAWKGGWPLDPKKGLIGKHLISQCP